MTYSLYGLTEELRRKLQRVADDKKWTLAQLIIEILKDYIGGNKR